MSTHTDGAPPSVRSAGTGDDPPAATAGVPPRPRRPSPSPVASSEEGDDDADAAAATPPPADRPATPGTPGGSGMSGAPDAATRRTGRSRRAADPVDGAEGSAQDWLQQEIARRVAEKKVAEEKGGVSDTGRHARPDTVGEPTPSPVSEVHARPAAPPSAPDPSSTPAPADRPAPTAAAARSAAAPPAAASTPAAPPVSPAPAPSSAAPSAADEDDDEDDEDTRAPRVVPDRSGSFRARSGWMPDPYSPAGLREPRAGDGWPPSDDGTGPEPAFRLAGPAARPRPAPAEASAPDGPPADGSPAGGSTAGAATAARGTVSPDVIAAWTAATNGTGPHAAAGDTATAGTDAPGTDAPGTDDARGTDAPGTADTATGPAADAAATTPAPAGPKQWPPATGASGLPRRVPGAGWTLDRATLLNGSSRLDTDTRPVPSTWAPAGRRTVTPDPLARSAEDAARADLAGPPTTDLGARVPATADLEDYDDDLDDFDEDDDPDEDLRGPAVERTEVIWRAPGLDDEPEPGSRAAVATRSPEVVRPPEVTPSENPYTGARPRRFAAEPTDPEPVDPAEAAADGPEGRRVRVVLSERRSTAQSVRPVVDVQDPGSVGTTLRNGLVNNQLALAVRVFGVALLGLGLLPALFAAFPSIGELAVLGLRVPWLLLGFLVYPFLFGLGWWYVNSAERVEQDFAEGVQDR